MVIVVVEKHLGGELFVPKILLSDYFLWLRYRISCEITVVGIVKSSWTRYDLSISTGLIWVPTKIACQ